MMLKLKVTHLTNHSTSINRKKVEKLKKSKNLKKVEKFKSRKTITTFDYYFSLSSKQYRVQTNVYY